jgi:hypothetical protein
VSVRVGLAVSLLVAGCTSPVRSLTEVFPPGSTAAPWVLQQEVWSGNLNAAAPALGDDATFWREHGPARVWLAVYCHEDLSDRCLKVRCFALPSVLVARQAFHALQPLEARPFTCGDLSCWTDIGVLIHWGRLVLEIFGGDASWSSQLEAALLATYIAKRMPAGLPENPR